jgi:hypothetical protein
VTPELLQRLARAAGGQGDAAPQPVAGRVVRVGDVAAKVFLPAEADRGRLEAALLRHLGGGDGGYRVQRLLDLVEVDGGVVLLTRWEAGAFKPYDRIAPDEWAQLGATLAALHRRLDQGELPVSGQLAALVRGRDLAHERALLVEQRARIADPAVRGYLDDRLVLLDAHGSRSLAGLPAGAERPIHNDYNQYNYLFDGGPLPLILDWERAILAPREYEVVRALNHLPLVAPVAARRFVDAYRAVRPLDPTRLGWAVDAALADHACKQWPLDSWLRGEPGAQARLDGLIPMVHTLAEGREQLAGFFA